MCCYHIFPEKWRCASVCAWERRGKEDEERRTANNSTQLTLRTPLPHLPARAPVAICGSLRKSSVNAGLLRAAARITSTKYNEQAQMEILDIGRLPLFNKVGVFAVRSVGARLRSGSRRLLVTAARRVLS